jgi:hypothetical protein
MTDDVDRSALLEFVDPRPRRDRHDDAPRRLVAVVSPERRRRRRWTRRRRDPERQAKVLPDAARRYRRNHPTISDGWALRAVVSFEDAGSSRRGVGSCERRG